MEKYKSGLKNIETTEYKNGIPIYKKAIKKFLHLEFVTQCFYNNLGLIIRVEEFDEK